jgi:hypothetical protein
LLFFNYRNGNIGTHHIAHGATDTIFRAFHNRRKISFFAYGIGFAQTFFRAGVYAQIASFAFVGVYFNSWHNSPRGRGIKTGKPIYIKYIYFSGQSAIKNTRIL